MKTTSQINIHELLNHPHLPDGYVLVIDTKCLACSIPMMAHVASKLISIDGGGWHKDKDVGDYICSYDDFRQLYPEYFI